MNETYFAVQFKSQLTNEWITEEKYFIDNYDSPQQALNLAIKTYEREDLYSDFEKRILKVSGEVVYGGE